MPQVFRNSDFPAATSCDDLYFKKQALFWADYKIGNIGGSCHFSKPPDQLYSSWNQKSEKLGRTAIMFSDKVSAETPDEGIKVDYNSLGAENIWAASSFHRISLPWTMESGFRTGTSQESLVFDFGLNLARSAVIWGMQFLTPQVAKESSRKKRNK